MLHESEKKKVISQNKKKERKERIRHRVNEAKHLISHKSSISNRILEQRLSFLMQALHILKLRSIVYCHDK